MQIKKTYKSINPGMLRDEIGNLIEKIGVTVAEAKDQTYPLRSGATQSSINMVFQIDGKECGSAYILGSPKDETKLILELEDSLLSKEKAASFQENLGFIFDSYEVKW
ncbi:MAG: hypothetical protein J7K94_03840 [Dehalococcoidia bacterium]|nr:hypothetical protein [Dehalococcoidia bacterium]